MMALLLLFALTLQSPPAPPAGVTTCSGEFALCAASTCTPVLDS